MKKLKYMVYAALLTAVLPLSSCKDNFKELATNPNNSAYALPEALLAPAITSVVSANMSRSQRLTNELMQVTVNMGDNDGKIFRYDILKSEADYLYNSWYTQMANFYDVYSGGVATNSKGFQGIALICEAWVYSMLTDTYGDVPYSQAIQAKNGSFMPAFDKQSDIYVSLFQKLETANTLLASATDVAVNSDPIYKGSVAKWRKFGNSLYLRLLLRVSAKSQNDASAKIKEIVETKASTYPIMTSNDDSAILRWSGTAPYVSPFATWRAADWYTPKLGSFFVDNLNQWSDPRVGKWATLYNGEYAGIPSGYAPGNAPEGKSSFPTSLQIEPLLGNILNYSELQFILSESAAKGWLTTKTAQSYYEAGITADITLWGYPVPANYMNFDLIKWNDSYTLDQKMELIHKQKYYALFFTDLQSWFECRRTGHPVLPKGPGLKNGGILPARLNYPVYLQSVNGANYTAAVAAQGPDNISTQVWWQKP